MGQSNLLEHLANQEEAVLVAPTIKKTHWALSVPLFLITASILVFPLCFGERNLCARSVFQIATSLVAAALSLEMIFGKAKNRLKYFMNSLAKRTAFIFVVTLAVYVELHDFLIAEQIQMARQDETERYHTAYFEVVGENLANKNR